MGMDVYGRRADVGVPPDLPEIAENASDEEKETAREAWLQECRVWEAKPGAYFRATVWSWRPIHDLMRQLCSDFIDEELMEHMGFNDGAGPEDQKICDEIAIRFSQWMEHNVDGHTVDHGMHVDGDGKFVDLRPKSSDEEGWLAEAALVESAQERFGVQGVEGVRSAHSIDDEHLKEWIEFLQHCGGFQVC